MADQQRALHSLLPIGSGAALGHTQESTLRITADDGSAFSSNLITCINASQDPELLELFRLGSLHRIGCYSDPDRVYTLAVPLLYHDPERELFALVVPDELRYQELRFRAELLEVFQASDDHLPAYIRRFRTVIGVEGLDALLSNPPESYQLEEISTPESPVESPAQVDATTITARPEMNATHDEELTRRAAALQENEDALELQRAQLEEVASRVERDSARVAEALTEVQVERQELHALRQELEEARRLLQVQELNLEQARLLQEQSGDDPAETTQVVTDDQFIEVLSEEALPREPLDSEKAIRSTGEHAPESFPVHEQPFFVESTQTGLCLGFSLPPARARDFAEGDVRFYFQLHRVDEAPALALTLVCFDDAGEAIDSVAAGLTDQGDEVRWLDKIVESAALDIVIYDTAGQKISAWETVQPEPRNVEWARRILAEYGRTAGVGATSHIQATARAITDGEVELWGSLRHPFHSNSFETFDGAAEVQLAAGILAYWSQPQQVEYLVGTRSFPLATFRDIQKRVIRQALHWGIALSEDLRSVAIEHAIIPDQVSLTQRLLANFVEVSLGLRSNDLDPLEEWENWDGLIKLSERYSVPIDPNVAELAEASFKRAQEYEDILDDEEEFDLDDEFEDAIELQLSDVEVDGLVVAKRSEHTGITYFLPDEALMDTFDDLSSMEQEDLLLLLKDDNGRLEAGQILVERFGDECLAEVLDASESMNVAQVTALAKFIEARADGLEAALIQSLDDAGPSGTYIAALALSAIGSTGALPRLIDALTDPPRRGHGRRLAKTLARFGDKLLPSLSRALKASPEDLSLLAALEALEQTRPGTIEELAADRSQSLRTAARLIRERAG